MYPPYMYPHSMIALELYKTELAFPEIYYFYNLKNYELIDNYLISDEIKEKDLHRFAYVRNFYKYHLLFNNIGQLESYLNKHPLEGDFFLNDPSYADIIWNHTKNPRVSSEGKHYHFIKTSKGMLFLEKISSKNDIQKTEETLPIAIDARLTRVGINMTGSRDIIYDPFCGTGTTLLQASSIGLFPIGFDNNYKMIKIARKNLGNKSYILKLMDSQHIDFSMDYIFTDLPYGKNTKNINPELYTKFADLITKHLKKRAVIILPYEVNMQGTIAKYSIYVHKNLTRTLMIIDKNLKLFQ